jgi:hypothetical protein
MAADVSSYEEQLLHETANMPDECCPKLLQVVRVFRENMPPNPLRPAFDKDGRKHKLARHG